MTNKFELSITGPQCCGKSRLIEEIKAKCSENFSIADGTPAGVELATGKTIVIKATTFVYPIELEAIYS